jgi:hypothetical protein
MPRKSQVPWRNRSPSGWWFFREIQQWVSTRQKKLTPKSRCLVWENTRIIKAKNRDEAFEKAMRMGEVGHPSKTLGGEWRFVGISQLLPVYDDLEDGAEILWDDRGSIPVSQITRLVKSKKQLPVFDDSEKNAEPTPGEAKRSGRACCSQAFENCC